MYILNKPVLVIMFLTATSIVVLACDQKSNFSDRHTAKIVDKNDNINHRPSCFDLLLCLHKCEHDKECNNQCSINNKSNARVLKLARDYYYCGKDVEYPKKKARNKSELEKKFEGMLNDLKKCDPLYDACLANTIATSTGGIYSEKIIYNELAFRRLKK